MSPRADGWASRVARDLANALLQSPTSPPGTRVATDRSCSPALPPLCFATLGSETGEPANATSHGETPLAPADRAGRVGRRIVVAAVGCGPARTGAARLRDAPTARLAALLVSAVDGTALPVVRYDHVLVVLGARPCPPGVGGQCRGTGAGLCRLDAGSLDAGLWTARPVVVEADRRAVRVGLRTGVGVRDAERLDNPHVCRGLILRGCQNV